VTAGDPLDEGSVSYGEALEELEDLLDELEAADVDVDVLAERVARGVELIRFCRARLEVVTGDVDAVVAELIPVDERMRERADGNGATVSKDDG
jgi:exodeoxyribonuclease VII small subunit